MSSFKTARTLAPASFIRTAVRLASDYGLERAADFLAQRGGNQLGLSQNQLRDVFNYVAAEVSSGSGAATAAVKRFADSVFPVQPPPKRAAFGPAAPTTSQVGAAVRSRPTRRFFTHVPYRVFRSPYSRSNRRAIALLNSRNMFQPVFRYPDRPTLGKYRNVLRYGSRF